MLPFYIYLVSRIRDLSFSRHFIFYRLHAPPWPRNLRPLASLGSYPASLYLKGLLYHHYFRPFGGCCVEREVNILIVCYILCFFANEKSISGYYK